MRRPDVIRFAAVALLRQRSRALVLILAVSLSVTSVLLLTAREGELDKINGLSQNGLGQSLTSLAGPIAAVTASMR